VSVSRANYPHKVVTKAMTMREYGAAVRWCMENNKQPAAIHCNRPYHVEARLVRVGRYFTDQLSQAVGGETDSTVSQNTTIQWANPRAFYFKSLHDAVLFQLKYL
jgi:hypothetical protein